MFKNKENRGKNMKKVIFKIILKIILMTLVVITLYNSQCFALGDVANDAAWQRWEPIVEDDSTIIDKTGVILGVIRIIGIIASVATLSVIGIKVMLGSVEEKANYKQTLIPWAIGAAMVFAITTIPTTIYDITKSTVKIGGSTEETVMNRRIELAQRIDSHDKAVSFVNSEFWKEGLANTTISAENTYNKMLRVAAKIQNEIKLIQGDTQSDRMYKSYLQGIQDHWLWFGTEVDERTVVPLRNELADFLGQYMIILQEIEGGYITKDNIEEEIKKYSDDSGGIKERLQNQKEYWETWE